MTISPKISQAKALVRFLRYGAAQEAALEENWIKADRNKVLGLLPRFVPLFLSDYEGKAAESGVSGAQRP